MKRTRIGLCAALILACPALWAADMVVGISPSSRNSIDAFDEPGQATPSRQIPVAEVTTPLSVLASQSGFLKVSLGGREVWVRAAQVRIKRDSGASCATRVSQFSPTGSTPGAGADACR